MERVLGAVIAFIGICSSVSVHLDPRPCVFSLPSDWFSDQWAQTGVDPTSRFFQISF